MSKAKATKKTLIKRGDGVTPTESFTTIGEVLSFQGLGESVTQIDVTSFDSDAKEYISSGLPDIGEISLEVNFVAPDTEQQGLRADLRAGTLRNFEIILNDHSTTGTKIEFAAIVLGFEGPMGGQDEQYKATIRLKPSGLPTITYAVAE